MNPRPPLPPFNEETAHQKVQAAEDAWNSRDLERVSLAYTQDTEWRNRTEFINGRAQVVEFLRRKWSKELDYRLKKELWGFRENRMAVRFAYEWHDESGQWYRSYGNELWEFDELVVPALFVHGTRDGFGSIDEMTEALKLIPARNRTASGHQRRTRTSHQAKS